MIYLRLNSRIDHLDPEETTETSYYYAGIGKTHTCVGLDSKFIYFNEGKYVYVKINKLDFKVIESTFSKRFADNIKKYIRNKNLEILKIY